MINKTLLLLFAVILISGCAMGPDFKNPETGSPEKYISAEPDSGTVADLEWWELFNDPVLDTLVKEAFKNNKDIGIAVARIEEAAAQYGFTRADIFPKLDISAGAAKGNFFGGLRAAKEQSSFFVTPTLSWEIDFWGKFRRANEAAKAGMLATGYAYHSVELSLFSEVAGTYFLLLDYRRRLEISKRTLASREMGLEIIQKRFDMGIIPEIDLNQAQIQLEVAAAAIPVFERKIRQTENALSLLLGRLPSVIKGTGNGNSMPSVPDIPMGLPADILERRPDILQAKYLLQAQNARIGIAEAMRFPSISLTGMFGLASNELSNLISDGSAWSLSGSLFGPLFNFNKNARRVEIEEAVTKQALLNYEKTVLNAFREVEDALIAVNTYRRQLVSVKRKYEAALNAAKLSSERYSKGVSSYLEVLDSERTLFSVELELSELQNNYYTSYIQLYKSLGGGWKKTESIK